MENIEAAARTLNELTGEWDWDRQLSEGFKERFEEIAREVIYSYNTGEPCPPKTGLHIRMAPR